VSEKKISIVSVEPLSHLLILACWLNIREHVASLRTFKGVLSDSMRSWMFHLHARIIGFELGSTDASQDFFFGQTMAPAKH